MDKSLSGIAKNLVTLRDVIRYGMTLFSREEVFFGHGTDNSLDEATFMALHVLHLPPDLPSHFVEARLLESEKQDILALYLERAESRKPAAYLINEAWFAGMSFYVDERVLVPRSPIAELIEKHFEPWIDAEQVESVLDLCTGSGCIGIATAEAFPEVDVVATDISTDALDVAAINVARYGLEDQVTLIQSDLFDEIDGQEFDIIVTNPPYVDAEELEAMPEEFQREPRLGLEAGADGLAIIDRILAEASNYLSANGILVAEVGASMFALMEKYPEVPFTWLDFERGGDGVFVLTRDQLLDCERYFSVD
jgi:ribosomal protein L3 glutamine methyltransferase